VILGVQTAQQASKPGVAELEIVDPELFVGPPTGSFTSVGGFSGFGSAALHGSVLGGGALVSVEVVPTEDETSSARGTIVIRSGSRELSVRFLSTVHLFKLVNIEEFTIGDEVVVRSEDGVVTSLLRVPIDGADKE